MARFPLSEAEILALGEEVIAGLAAHAAIYPAPPIAVADLQASLAALITARDAVVAARAAAEQATAAKDEALRVFVAELKSDIRYAENSVDFDDDRLKLIGWGGRHARAPLQPPGQPRELEAPKEGEGWIRLEWKEPTDGGAVAAYKIQRRARPDGSWLDVGTALTSEITLNNQERGKEWEYRIVAVNKAGALSACGHAQADSEPSNTVMAVL